ncbi:MAG: diaminopimelate epimerase [Pseudomonadota bacterium]
MESTAPFAKMNGIGNQILVADMRAHGGRVASHAAVALAADAHTHFDQLMAVYDSPSQGQPLEMEIFNADGSRAGACGNGTRCVVDYLSRHGMEGTEIFRFSVEGKPLAAKRLEDGRIAVNMGLPRLEWDQIPLSEEFADTRGIELEIGPAGAPLLHTPSVANMGNPHVIFWAQDSVENYALDKFGPMIENHMLFPDRVNVTVAQVTGPESLTMRTWERGAGLTQACGSAACAAVVSAARLGKTGRKVTATLPGGQLEIEWRDDLCVIMTGGATHEFDGRFNPATGQWEKLGEPV